MPADFTNLDKRLSDLTDQVTRMETVGASVKALIASLKASSQQAIADAVQADNDIDNSKIATLNQALDGVFSRFEAVADDLGQAVVTVPPQS